MKWFGAVFAAGLFVATQSKAVIDAGDSDFDSIVAKAKYNLVELYAPWCGHCKQLAPQYEAAAEELAKTDLDVQLIAVDATEAKELGTRFGVQGFPTLKWLVNGEPSDYQGGRSQEDIVSWVTKKTGPPAVDITDAAGFEAFKVKADVVVVGYFESKDSAAAKAFIGAAETDDDSPYGISTSTDVRDAAGLSGEGVVLFRKFEAPDEPRVECSGDLTTENIKDCVSANILPLLIPFSQANAPKIFGGSIKQHVLLFTDKSADHHATTADAARPVASSNKGDYLFVTVDKSDSRILEFFDITEGDLPTARVVVMGDAGMKKFSYEEATLDEAGLSKFVAAHKAGELKQALKSEDDIADEDQKEDVWVLTGGSHDRLVFGGKNVLVEYYAPWCGHCKKLEPIYKELGAHYKDDDNVLIAKMDSTANEVEAVSIQGFPTLKFVQAGSNELMDFDGGRDLDSMKEFIEKNRK